MITTHFFVIQKIHTSQINEKVELYLNSKFLAYWTDPEINKILRQPDVDRNYFEKFSPFIWHSTYFSKTSIPGYSISCMVTLKTPKSILRNFHTSIKIE